MNPNNVAYVGNRSLVIHDYMGDRIACANFKPLKLSPDQTCVEDSETAEEGGEHQEEEFGPEEPIEEGGTEDGEHRDGEHQDGAPE